MDRDPKQSGREINPGLSHDEAAKYLLNLKNPLDRVIQGHHWMDMNGYAVTQVPHVSAIIINNAVTIAEELRVLRRQQMNSQLPQKPD